MESHRQVERISAIIDHLLIFGRSDITTNEGIRLDNVFENTLLLIGERLRLNDITIDLKVDDNLVTITGNASQLEQVFLNLIQNASDAMKDQLSERNITVVFQSTPDHLGVQVTLSDDGAGISSEHIDKIFDPFFTTKEVGKGTGLGLSVVYGIVRDHGGTITCESELDQGTTFSITLPAAGIEHA